MVGFPAVITGSQCRAGRALVNLTMTELAEAAALSESLIAALENDDVLPSPAEQAGIRTALEAAGVLFIPEQGGEGVGVRFKFAAQTVKRLQTWEGEGGTVAEDDIA